MLCKMKENITAMFFNVIFWRKTLRTSIVRQEQEHL